MNNQEKLKYLQDFNKNINSLDHCEYISRPTYNKLIKYYNLIGYIPEAFNEGFNLTIVEV